MKREPVAHGNRRASRSGPVGNQFWAPVAGMVAVSLREMDGSCRRACCAPTCEGRQSRQIFITLSRRVFSSSIESWPSVATAALGRSETALALRGLALADCISW